jgi:SagB-type dehydrogenase family enzyme
MAIFEFDFLEEEPPAQPEARVSGPVVRLPEPRWSGPLSLEQAIQKRRSRREFRKEALTLEDVAQLLWAAQGITDPEGLRSVPSAGATYPLELYLLVIDVRSLNAGLYHYVTREHALVRCRSGDLLPQLMRATRGQDWIAGAGAVLLIAAHPGRTRTKYGERGDRYTHLEAGHAAQNVCLQCEALGLSTALVGAFDDGAVRGFLELKDEEIPLCFLPVGRPASR